MAAMMSHIAAWRLYAADAAGPMHGQGGFGALVAS